VEELQGTHPEHKNKPSEMKPEIRQTQSCRYKTIVVIKRYQQNTKSKKEHEQQRWRAKEQKAWMRRESTCVSVVYESQLEKLLREPALSICYVSKRLKPVRSFSI